MSQAEQGGQERELPPAINGTEERLDAILAELRAIRSQMQPPAAPSDTDTIRLREPTPSKPPKRR